MVLTSAAVLCLAANIYHEARGEPVDGQIAVAQVTLNRVASPRYPDRVCEVVHDPYQFTWTLDPQPIRDPEAYALAVYIAQNLSRFDDLSGGATHYYAPSKAKPYWRNLLTPVGQIANHRFMLEQ